MQSSDYRNTNIIPKTAKCKQNGGVFGVSAARPGHDARWIIYISTNISHTKKNYQTKKLDPDYKIFVSKFDIDILTNLAATTGFAKCYFCGFSQISL